MEAQELQAELSQFTGSETLAHYGKILVTEGVRFLAKNAQCYWLLDVIASYQPQLKEEHYQFWKLHKNGNSAVVICERDTDEEILRQDIEFTDFPLDTITLYVVNQTVMLPSEY